MVFWDKGSVSRMLHFAVLGQSLSSNLLKLNPKKSLVMVKMVVWSITTTAKIATKSLNHLIKHKLLEPPKEFAFLCYDHQSDGLKAYCDDNSQCCQGN